MTPVLASNDVANRGSCDSEFVSEEWAIATLSGVPLPNFHNIGLAQFGSRARLSGQWLNSPTSLSVHISHVVKLRTEEQMIGTHTCRNIAMVADLHPFWNRAVRQFPTHAMSTGSRAFMAAKANNSVPKFRQGTGPQPAGFSFGDFGPETISNRNGITNTAHDPRTSHGAETLRIRSPRLKTRAALLTSAANQDTIRRHRMLTPFGVTPPAALTARGNFVSGILP